MRRGPAIRWGTSLACVAAVIALAGCARNSDEVVGRWQADDGAVIEFSDDGTFEAEDLALGTVTWTGVPDEELIDLVGEWYVESPFENPFPSGDAVILLIDGIPLKLALHLDPAAWTISFTGQGLSTLYVFQPAE